MYNSDGAAMSQWNGEYPHWSRREDLVATSNATGSFTPAVLTDAFGHSVSGTKCGVSERDWRKVRGKQTPKFYRHREPM